VRGERQDTNNILLLKNFVSGASGEPFLEYLSSLYFINKGYIVENQVPWFQQNFSYKGERINGGIPDFSAFHSSFSDYLKCLSIISEDKGIIVNLLPVITKFKKIKTVSKLNSTQYKYELLLGEAKVSNASAPAAIKQLKQYQKVDLANKLFTIIPDLEDNGTADIGEIYLKKYSVQIRMRMANSPVNTTHQNIDNEWISNYLKILLLGNVPFQGIKDLIKAHRFKTGQALLSDYEAHHLLDAILSMDNNSFIGYLTKYI
jgi:hypothetical protein